MKLEVAEACSGIRSLMSLFTLAVFYGYFLEKTATRRTILALASIPIAVAANVFRIVGTGLCVQYWDPAKALGFFHEFSGLVIFIISLCCVYLVHRIIKLVKPGTHSAANQDGFSMKSPRYWTVVSLLARGYSLRPTGSHRGDRDNVPPSEPLSLMPQTIDGMSSREFPLDDGTLAVLGKGDFLNRVYYSPSPTLQPASTSSQPSAPTIRTGLPISLFIGYFATQRTGQSIHSPQHCLPGSGWTFDTQYSRYTKPGSRQWQDFSSRRICHQ